MSFVFRYLGVLGFQNSVNYLKKFLFIRNYLCSLF